MARVLPLLAALLAAAVPAAAVDIPETGLPVEQVLGGGPAADDCLGSLEVVGRGFPSGASRIVCRDGDVGCDRDGLVNGRCELWVRACGGRAAKGCAARAVSTLSVAGDGADAVMLERTAELLAKPTATDGACGALTTLTVPLGERQNGSARVGRTRLTIEAEAADGRTDLDHVTFVCKPPERERRRDQITFALLQKRVFAKSCGFSGCHGETNPQAGLRLVGAGVYDQLVDRLASTSSAKFSGKKLIVPGAPETSFLMDKIEGRLGPGEGSPMPFGRSALSAAQIEAIRKWILAGAPRERAVAGGLGGEADLQPRITAPAVPPSGYQAHLSPFMLGDAPETEGCQMVRLDNPEALMAGAWELFMHEGSHHFILRAHRCGDRNGNGTDDCDDPDFDAQFPEGFQPCERFGTGWGFVIGSQTPHSLVDYQTAVTGVAFPLHRRQPLLLNAHYTNPFADTKAEVWVNVTPVDPALARHPARILFEEVANVFLKIPPGTTSDAGTYLSCAFRDDGLCKLAGEPQPTAGYFALLGLTSHMHKRSHRFVTDLFAPDGTRVSRGADDMVDARDGTSHFYVSTTYNDPINLNFWPPIVVQRGQELRYTCHHENGVVSPVRRGCEETAGVTPGRSMLEQFAIGQDIYEGAARWCRSDADCAGFGTGRCVPANLVFGELADDEMCILPGLFYPCPGDAASCMD
jgi:hypothetical protein